MDENNTTLAAENSTEFLVFASDFLDVGGGGGGG